MIQGERRTCQGDGDSGKGSLRLTDSLPVGVFAVVGRGVL